MTTTDFDPRRAGAPMQDTFLAVVLDRERRRSAWVGLFCGAVLAVSTILLLNLLGMALGFTVVDPAEDASPMSGMVTTTGLWTVATQLIGLCVGGFVAVRLADTADTARAVSLGATVWGIATLLALWLATSAVGSMVATTYSAAANTATAARNAVEAVVPEDLSLPDLTLPDVSLEALPPEVQDAIERQGLTASDLRAEAREAYRTVISRSEQRRAAEIATSTAVDVIQNPRQALAEIDQGINRLVGQGGVISAEDRAELAALMERRLGITPAEAEATIDRWIAEAEQAMEATVRALRDAQQASLAAAGEATDALASTMFWAFVASLLGLAAAIGGGIAGRVDPADRADVA